MKKYEHGGDIYSRCIDYDFSANLNPLGISESIKAAVISAASECGKYPDPNCRELVKALSEFEDVPPENIVCGNGASDIIYRIVYAAKPKKALLCAPTFCEYEKALTENNCTVKKHYLREENGFAYERELISEITPEIDIIFLCNPNNPVGNTVSRELLAEISERCLKTGTLLAADECFLDFVKNGHSAKEFLHEKMIVLKAFTKSHAMAGLRLGYAVVGSKELARRIKESGQAWSVSVLAQAAGLAALKEPEYAAKAIPLIEHEREYLAKELSGLGIKVYASEANFLLFYCNKRLEEPLLEKRTAIRSCENYDGLGIGYYRIAVHTHEKNAALIAAIKEVLWADR